MRRCCFPQLDILLQFFGSRHQVEIGRNMKPFNAVKKTIVQQFLSVGLAVSTLLFAGTLKAEPVKPIYVVHIRMGNAELAQTVESELRRSLPNSENRPIVFLRPNINVANNPFGISRYNFEMGYSRTMSGNRDDLIPLLNSEMTKWFADLEAKDIHPEIFILNGHHTPGLGFYSNSTWDTKRKDQFGQSIEFYNQALFMPSLYKSAEKIPVVNRFFSKIKMVFIGGCWGLANLQPKEFGDHGRLLTKREIYNFYQAGQLDRALGTLKNPHSLAYQKNELTTIYSDDYAKNESGETCLDNTKTHCERYAIDRILPDSGLWDGSDMYNIPLKMKRLFPNALGIFGFHRPSPYNPGAIWRSAFSQARSVLKTNNILIPLLSDSVSIETKKTMIQKLRIAWTKASFALNRGRANGSITPAFPELDQNGPFAYEPNAREFPSAPKFAPYEVGKGDASVIETTSATASEKNVVEKDEDAYESLIMKISNTKMEQYDEKPAKKLRETDY